MSDVYTENLQFSQSIRRRIAEQLTAENIPSDHKDMDILLRTLKDMDQTTLNERKNQIDESSAGSAKTIADAMNELVKMNLNTNPFQRNPDGSVDESYIPKIDASKLGDHNLVPGETEIGTVIETSNEFITRMEAELANRPVDDEDDELQAVLNKSK